MPVDNGGDGYGYDLAVNPTKNVLLTSSFTSHVNYMRPLGELIKDEAAMKRFGNTMVAWDPKARCAHVKPLGLPSSQLPARVGAAMFRGEKAQALVRLPEPLS